MQLFWVSGSTGDIKQINITKERLVRIGIIVSSAFLFLGILIFSTGIHIALEVNPDFAREVSGIVTVRWPVPKTTHQNPGSIRQGEHSI